MEEKHSRQGETKEDGADSTGYKNIIGGVSKYEGPQVKIQFPRRIPVHFIHPLEVNLKELVE